MNDSDINYIAYIIRVMIVKLDRMLLMIFLFQISRKLEYQPKEIDSLLNLSQA
jgi:hypothetical protein